MPAPRDIIDALESVVSIYFSDVRHRVRAAFILNDELVEMCCKALAMAANPTLGHINFPQLLAHPAVKLTPASSALGETLRRNHDTRNKMQHVNAAFTVDDQHCADAILDTLATIEHCFPGSKATLREDLRVALRIVKLQSSVGDVGMRGLLEDTMRKHRWNGSQRTAKVSEPPVAVGTRRYWGIVLFPQFNEVDGILNSLGVPLF